MVKVYSIKPLAWTGEINNGLGEITASTPFGEYSICLIGDDCLWSFDAEPNWPGECRLSKSIEIAKQKCWQHWVERLSGALEEVVIEG